MRTKEQSYARFRGRDFILVFKLLQGEQIFPLMGERSYKCLCGIKRDLEMKCNPVPQIWNCMWLAWAFQENPVIHCPNLIQIIRFWIKVGYRHQNQKGRDNFCLVWILSYYVKGFFPIYKPLYLSLQWLIYQQRAKVIKARNRQKDKCWPF